eukprot:scaffold271186_cov39-Tisochrysis_lutea.AAC.1
MCELAPIKPAAGSSLDGECSLISARRPVGSWARRGCLHSARLPSLCGRTHRSVAFGSHAQGIPLVIGGAAAAHERRYPSRRSERRAHCSISQRKKEYEYARTAS